LYITSFNDLDKSMYHSHTCPVVLIQIKLDWYWYSYDIHSHCKIRKHGNETFCHISWSTYAIHTR